MIPKLTAMFVAKSSVALNLFLLGALVLLTVSNSATVRGLNDQIDNPKTGYKIQLLTTSGYWEACKRNREVLVNSIETQNKSVSDMASASATMASAGREALAAVRKQNAPMDTKIRKIVEARPTGDVCRSADTLILETVK